jgi:hypothetical protein
LIAARIDFRCPSFSIPISLRSSCVSSDSWSTLISFASKVAGSRGDRSFRESMKPWVRTCAMSVFGRVLFWKDGNEHRSQIPCRSLYLRSNSGKTLRTSRSRSSAKSRKVLLIKTRTVRDWLGIR